MTPSPLPKSSPVNSEIYCFMILSRHDFCFIACANLTGHALSWKSLLQPSPRLPHRPECHSSPD